MDIGEPFPWITLKLLAVFANPGECAFGDAGYNTEGIFLRKKPRGEEEKERK